MVLRPRQPQQGPSSASLLDENYRESVRRSIEYLRRTSKIGPENGSAAFQSWKRMHSASLAAAADRYAARSPAVPPQQQQQGREPFAGGKYDGGLHHGRYNNNRPVDYVDEQTDEQQQQQQRRGEALRVVQQQQPRAEGHHQNRGRLLLIIDVQSRRGAVEEVSCREGDNCFDLARGFIVRRVAPVSPYV